MKRKLFCVGLAMMLLFGGCGGGGGSSDGAANISDSFESAGAADVTADYEMNGGAEENASAPGVGQSASPKENKKIITEQMTVETTEFESVIALVQQKTESLGGYVEYSEISGSKELTSQYATLRLRIPAERLREFVTAVDEKGTIVYDSRSTEDVTLEYVDTESHLKSLEIEEEALFSLLEKAEKLSDIFDIQERLTQVRYEIEGYASRLRVYDNQVDYSTVNLTVNEVQRETEAVERGFWPEALAAFSDSLYFLNQLLRAIGIFLIGGFPIWAFFAAIVFVLVKILRRPMKKNRSKPLPPNFDRKPKQENAQEQNVLPISAKADEKGTEMKQEQE